MFDVVVLGAGPAGAAAAVTARAEGLSVALVDKARFPRDKLCGGGLTGRAVAAMGRIFGAAPEDALEARHVRIVAGGRVIGDWPDAPAIQMVMRRAFDAGLVARALAAGAEDLTGQRVASVDAPAGVVRLASERGVSGRAVAGRVLIGADGANSAVARALHGRPFDPATIAFALEIEAPARPPGAAVEIDLRAAAWGYGWAFPKTGSLTLGVGGLQRANADMKAALATYVVRHGATAAGCKGAFLPTGRMVQGQRAVLLAGDAAGCVDPITGEGIAWAMETGHLAARAAAAALAMGAPDRAAALHWAAMAPVRRELRRARLLGHVVHHRLLQVRCHRLLEARPRLQVRFLDLLAGRLDYADIGLASLWRVARGLVRV